MSSRQFTVPTHIVCPHRNPGNAICGKRVDFSAFKWYTNTNRNAKYKQILKTRCGTHLFICPICYCSHSEHKRVVDCFYRHSDSVRCGANCDSTTACRDYNYFIVKQMGIHGALTSSKRKRLIDMRCQDDNELQVSRSTVTELQNFENGSVFAEENATYDDVSLQGMTESIETCTDRIVSIEKQMSLLNESKKAFNRSIVKCLSHRLSCKHVCNCSGKHLPTPLPRKGRGDYSPFPTESHLDFTIKHRINSNISDSNLDRLLLTYTINMSGMDILMFPILFLNSKDTFPVYH